ncbi:unnamed protein product [Brassica rapa]|uniref:Uncharacterized protein n=2 Tax=Brassica TaxID=3705 RepID=A0A3P6AAF0_BRACM|nr:unnamed protein product [Brassica napus]CAG7893874.1 unnamed protein product [Brassica rapa]CDY26889.1 BnaA02g19140D [Brassica napus]VDC89322.1 unnamed protein product [Brassica rapa]
MNNFIVFLFVITICFGLSEACAESRVVFKNEIGNRTIFHVTCQSWNPAISHGQINIQPDRSHIFRFVSAKERTTYICNLFYQLPVDPHNPRPRIKQFHHLEAFRAGTRSNKCGQYREWCARHDAIYFRRNPSDPLGPVLRWTTID